MTTRTPRPARRPQHDPEWLDLPIRSLAGRGRSLNPQLAWFTDQLPGRAQTAILKAARGELRDTEREPLSTDCHCPVCARCEPGFRCDAWREQEKARERQRQRNRRLIDRGLAERTHAHLPPLRTLREFIALPSRTLLLQRWYGYKTHMDLCHAFRASGVTERLFSGDEDRLPRREPHRY